MTSQQCSQFTIFCVIKSIGPLLIFPINFVHCSPMNFDNYFKIMELFIDLFIIVTPVGPA